MKINIEWIGGDIYSVSVAENCADGGGPAYSTGRSGTTTGRPVCGVLEHDASRTSASPINIIFINQQFQKSIQQVRV